MAWPKKGTRKISVDGVVYLWHYAAHCPLCSDDVFTVGLAGRPYVLFIDPFPWHFRLTPAAVAAAIRWATDHGWTPDKGPTRAMARDGSTGRFVWLPAGQRHLHCQDRLEQADAE